jgi:hypothetical protein
VIVIAVVGVVFATHFRTIAGFVFSENIDTAVIGGLVMYPFIGLVCGALGGALGAGSRRTGRSGCSAGHGWRHMMRRALPLRCDARAAAT